MESGSCTNGNQAGNADIYLQSVGGLNAINLTKDSVDDDTEPAFSPDGESVAFRSERQGGGIFIMGRTGESVRRATDGGYNPAWSPDGMHLIYATDRANPAGRNPGSELWTVTLASGEKHRIGEGDAVQPSWSPHGHRIAYWGLHKGAQRDIWTIPASGGVAVPVTDDLAVDWNPVWSPDGRYLYFASNRAGSMNLWRIEIDEITGNVQGDAEAITTPAPYVGHLSVAADGRTIAYTAFVENSRIEKLRFDPVNGSVSGSPIEVLGGSQVFTSPAPSPDGDAPGLQVRRKHGWALHACSGGHLDQSSGWDRAAPADERSTIRSFPALVA